MKANESAPVAVLTTAPGQNVNPPVKGKSTMRKIQHPRRVRHGLFELPLFRWSAIREVPPFTVGGRWVHRRTGLPSTLANVVAELAGIGREHW
jgi:hypothetical protein